MTTSRARAISPAVALAICLGCSGSKTITVDVGIHRVRLTVPKGWEHLEHGRSQILRQGESQMALVDMGPGTREGIAREIAAARALWLEGRRKDAFERIRSIGGPSLLYAASDQVTGFWRPWWEMKALGSTVDSATVGAAFDSLVAHVALLPDDSPQAMARFALDKTSNPERHEISRQSRRLLNDANWVDIETWDRVTHLDRRRLALRENGGYLLVLYIERDPLQVANPVFEEVLVSIQTLPGAP
jgi:hypothetical protein